VPGIVLFTLFLNIDIFRGLKNDSFFLVKAYEIISNKLYPPLPFQFYEGIFIILMSNSREGCRVDDGKIVASISNSLLKNYS